MFHLSGCSAVSCHLTVYTKFRTPSLTKLLANEAVKSYILRHEPEILEQFELVVNTVSMEAAVHLQVGQAETPAEQD